MIRVQDLTQVYRGGISAVDGLDLSVGRGEVFGLLGPNGTGKTTTVGMLTTRILPTRGSALARAAADYLLERFRLGDRADAEVGTLSGGMARRLMVARAVLHRPAVLFLDEPTAGLDPQSRLALWDLIAELGEEGHTVLLTTHFMEEADRLCDQVAILDHGRVLALDTPTTLKRSLGGDTEVRISVSGDAGRFAEDLAGRPGRKAVGPPRVSDNTVRMFLRGASEGVLPTVIATAGERRVAVTDFSMVEPTLETVFINLTGKELRE